MYDAIIVGARCAGSPTAMLLARKGYRVLLVDKAHFPSDTLSTHYIHQPGIAHLKRWQLLDKVASSNCPPVSSITVDLGPFALSGSPPPIDGVADGYAPRRTILDNVLVNAAVDAGAELRDRFTMDDLVFEDDRVVGVRGHEAGGGTLTEKSRVVIGADGLRSAVARGVSAETYHQRPTFSCAYYSYWADVPIAGAELYPRPDNMIIAFPTNDGQVLTVVFWPNAAFHRVRSDIEGNFMEALDLAPGLSERVRQGTRADRFRGTADLRNQFRRSHGPGWALVGDAGYHKDPNTAQGITDAFRSAELLADALDDGFSGQAAMESTLATYEEHRNREVMPMYEFTCELAALQPPSPEHQQLFGALHGNQEQTNRFLGTITGTVPIPEFFSPENVGKIMAGSGIVPATA